MKTNYLEIGLVTSC